MRSAHRSERGQILVLVAFGFAALAGMTALAIDGGNAYSDRRHAQNAADTSALATGLAYVNNPDASAWNDAVATGMSRAADNGYDNNGTSNVVNILKCNDPAATCGLPSPLPPLPGGSPDLSSYYFQTTITSHVPTYLAKVLGITQVTNSVQAVVHAVPPWLTERNHGGGLVSLMPGCKPPDGSWPNQPFEMDGTAHAIVSGWGVFVNSDCQDGPPYAYYSSNNNLMETPDGSTCVRGIQDPSAGPAIPPVDELCDQPAIDLQEYKLPPVTLDSCTAEDLAGGGQITPDPDGIAGHYVATAGTYNQPFPNVTPAGQLKLGTGIYCLKNGLSLSSGWTITTDLDGNGTYFDGSDGAYEGVLFYVDTGAVTFNGGSYVKIGAMNNINVDIGIRGYLIYLPPTNDSPVKIAGSNNSEFVGTILAPSSLITLDGGSSTDSLNLQCQVIGYSIKITGNGTLTITYNGAKEGKAWTNPILQLHR